jgi:hypothetical protein
VWQAGEVFFWIGVGVVVVVVVGAVGWAVRGFEEREHEPGTTYMD